jgi:RNA polymerase sigma-70 factor (ECF subfamily)
VQATTDSEIMKMVQRGDVNKLGLLYEKYHKDLYQYFYRLTRQREKSEDLVHNVFIKVMKYSKNFKGQGQHWKWWP